MSKNGVFLRKSFKDFATIIISLCALGLTLWQGIEIRKSFRETKEYNQLSVRPYLTNWSSMDDGYYKYELINNGLGPALIKNLIVKIDGQQILMKDDDSIKKAIELLFSHSNYTYDVSTSFLGKGYAIAPKDRVNIAEIKFTGKKPSKKFIVDRIRNHAELIVNYQSVYGENFSFPYDQPY